MATTKKAGGTMAPTIDRPKPPYQQIADHLRQDIRNGALRDGDNVPSVRQLAANWNVANGTARSALALLRTEGLVVGVPGTGTVVQARTEQGAGIRASTVRSTGRIYADNQYARIVSAATTPAPEPVAVALSVDPGAPVIRRERVTYVRSNDGEDDEVASSSISWFHAGLAEPAPRLLETERIRQGTFTYIGEATGRIAREGLEERGLATASEDEAARLNIAAGTPIIQGENWMLDADGGVIEYGQSILHPNRKITYRFSVDQEGEARQGDAPR